jgi:hypothetical protein
MYFTIFTVSEDINHKTSHEDTLINVVKRVFFIG